MKRVLTLSLFVLIYLSLNALTYTVGLESSFDYQSIQSAIDNAVNGDSIIVYPGIYYENIDFLEKSLFLGSLYSLTADTTYISQTIIDGQKQNNVIVLCEVYEATIEGFTIQNGFAKRQVEYVNYTSDNISNGGGIMIVNYEENPGVLITISNNIIKNNYADKGGGVWSRGILIHFKGNQIFRNSAISDGGGIHSDIYRWGDDNNIQVFSNEEKNSVYFNTSGQFNDICISSDVFNYNISLKKGTFANHIWPQIGVSEGFEPDGIYVTIEEGLIEMVDADLYVSPDGDDSNSGLSPEEPLKTITMAMLKQKGHILDHFPPLDSLAQAAYWNPVSEHLGIMDSLSSFVNTIYVADGVYSEETGNLFPIKMKNHIRIVGESKENTIIDLGAKHHGFVHGFERWFTMTPSDIQNPNPIIMPYLVFPIISIENFTIKNSFSHDFKEEAGKSIFSYSLGYGIASINNIKCIDSEVENSGGGNININLGYRVKLSNIHIIRNNSNPDTDFPLYAIKHDGCNGSYTMLENIIIDGGLGGIRIISSTNTALSNLLIKNLQSTNTRQPNYAIWIDGGGHSPSYPPENYEVTQIINATICDNNLISGLLSFNNNIIVNVYNSIFYANNPSNTDFSVNYQGRLIFSHNLFEQSLSALEEMYYSGWYIILDESNLTSSDPMFVGVGDNPERLSCYSPAIFAGTLDIPPYFESYNYDLTYELPEYDLIGNPRVTLGLIDIGAYAYDGVGITDDDTIPKLTKLYSNYPNPFNPDTHIKYFLNADSYMELEIFNIKGQKLKTLDKGFKENGEHIIVWNGKDDNNHFVGSGIYFYRLKTDNYSSTKKMILIK
ncbi:MAG: T9SS type A sorting domain-containing protein [Candidatus Cloacimonetes bacterium]|nr:T9SS type A sorting domain-containing protein [Candidatus Cloacimonadota bacterium]